MAKEVIHFTLFYRDDQIAQLNEHLNMCEIEIENLRQQVRSLVQCFVIIVYLTYVKTSKICQF